MKLCPICATSYPPSHRTCPTHGTVLVDTQELPPGTMVRDCYRIERMLGKGGMGTVYLAEHTLMGEPRALKFLSAELASNPLFVQRFLQEARAANKLRHPNVAQTMELGQTEDGSFYISMEFVDGPSLRSVLNQAPGGLPLERAFNIVHGVAEALGAAHAKRMVHRDIKPENILLATTPEGEMAKVVDFGIVAMNDGGGRLTQTGSVLLTCEYAAPEQWRGVIPSSELDGRTDLYAMGCMFFEMLTGRLPFRSDSYEGWFELHVHTAPPAPSSIRPELANWPGLDGLVLKLMAKDRENRPANVREFLVELEGVTGLGTTATTAQPPVAAADDTTRRRTVVDIPRPSGNYGQTPTIPPVSTQGPSSGQVPAQNSGSQYVPQPGPLPGRFPGDLQYPGSGQYPPNAGQQYPGSGQYPGQAPAQGPYPPQGFIPQQSPQTPDNHGGAGQYTPPYNYVQTPPPPVKPSGMSGTSRVLLGTVGALVIVAIAVIATMMMLHKDSGSKDDQSGSQTQPQTQPEKQTQPQVQTPPGGSTGPQTGAQAGTTPPGASTAEKPLGKNDQVASNIPRTPPGNLSGKTGGATAGSAGIAKQAIAMYNNKQFAQAQPLLQDACDRGNADCCEHLGFMYESSSLGVARDYTHAVTLLDKACKGGSMLGCSELAIMYQHKLGVDQDYPRALALFKKACDGGEPGACNGLGIMYEKGQSVDQDYARAAALYNKACNGGDASGCSDLGNMYRTGNSVIPKDTEKAKVLLSKGCNMGNKWGCERLKEIQ